MKLHTLPKTNTRAKKRLGRGYGSGRGKTAGRGTKGQNARGTMPPHFEGGQLSVIRRLPYLRGKGRNKSRSDKPVRVPVGKLDALSKSIKVTAEALSKAGIIPEGTQSVKVLAGGKLSGSYTVAVPCSAGAKNVIEKAGGQVVE